MPDLALRRRDELGRLLPRTDSEIPQEKTCTRCSLLLPLDAYSPDRRKADKRMSRCRVCCAKVAAERRAKDLDATRSYDRSDARRRRRNVRLRERRRLDRAYAARIDAVRELRRQLKRAGISTEDLHRRDGGICHLCETPVALDESEPDHVVPLALGGSNEPINVRIAHGTCNRRKGARLHPVMARNLDA